MRHANQFAGEGVEAIGISFTVGVILVFEIINVLEPVDVSVRLGKFFPVVCNDCTEGWFEAKLAENCKEGKVGASKETLEMTIGLDERARVGVVVAKMKADCTSFGEEVGSCHQRGDNWKERERRQAECL